MFITLGIRMALLWIHYCLWNYYYLHITGNIHAWVNLWHFCFLITVKFLPATFFFTRKPLSEMKWNKMLKKVRWLLTAFSELLSTHLLSFSVLSYWYHLTSTHNGDFFFLQVIMFQVYLGKLLILNVNILYPKSRGYKSQILLNKEDNMEREDEKNGLSFLYLN